MKIDSDRKREVYMDAFEVLKDQYSDNKIELHEIIEKMCSIDISTTVEMWKYLIKHNPTVLHNDFDFAFWYMYVIGEAIGQENVYELVLNDAFLKNAIYRECGDLHFSPLEAVAYLIQKNELDSAIQIIQMIVSNKYKKQNMYDILLGIIPDKGHISNEALEMLNEMIERISDKQQRVKLNLKIMKLLDEDD